MRSTPTGRQLRLGAELRRLRERAGLTSTQAAGLLGIKQNQVSNMEAGRHGVSPDRLRFIAGQYGCEDPVLLEALSTLSPERRRGWWEEYRGVLPNGLLDLAELENHATALRAGTTAHIPGLLQIHDHAREVFRQAVPELSPPELEHRLSLRIKRQIVLFDKQPTPYLAIIHEAALRMQFGGPEVAKRQLKHILDMSERTHITVLAIPFSAGGYPGAGQSILYASGPVPQLDTVHLYQSHGSAFIDVSAQLADYRLLLDRMEALTINPDRTRQLIHRIAQDL